MIGILKALNLACVLMINSASSLAGTVGGIKHRPRGPDRMVAKKLLRHQNFA
jgi:hypothetical protein